MTAPVAPFRPSADSPRRTRAPETLDAGTPPKVADAEPLTPELVPIEKVRGKQYPDSDAKEGAKVAFLASLASDTDTTFVARAKSMAYHLLMASGKQHLAWSNRSRKFEELPLEPNELRATVNYIRPILRARTNRLLPTRLDWQIIPDSNAYDARDAADVGERWLDRMTERTLLLSKVDIALELSYCGGVAFLKGYWDPSIGEMQAATLKFQEQMPVEETDPETGEPRTDPETGEPIYRTYFDGQGVEQPVLTPVEVTRYVNEFSEAVDKPEEAYWFRTGDTDIAVRSLFNVRWNPDASGFTPSEGLRWLVDEDYVPIEVARERYPEYAEKIQPDGDSSGIGTYMTLARDANIRHADKGRAQNLSSKSRTEGQAVRVIEYWELPSAYFPGGRCMVMVGRCLVYDGEFPDGRFPYIPIYDEPTALSPSGRGVVGDLCGPQGILNEQYASIIASSRMQGLGQFVTFNFPGMPELVTAQHGAVLKMPMRMSKLGKSPAELFQSIQHPPIPTDRFALIDFCRDTMYQLGAFHEITRGQTPPGVTSGVAVRALSEREDGQLKRAVNALRTSLVELGRTQLGIARYRDNPESTRWLPVSRPDLGYQIQSVQGAKLPDPDRVLLTLEGFKPRSEEELRADTMEAFNAGLISGQTALKVFDLGRGVKSVHQSEQRHYARARNINLAIEQGRVQPDVLRDETGQPIILDPEQGEPALQAKWRPDYDGQAEWEPVVLPEIDDHILHLTVLEELILDNTKSPEVRQLAEAIYMERKQVMQSAMPPAPKPDSDPSSGNDPQAALMGGA